MLSTVVVRMQMREQCTAADVSAALSTPSEYRRRAVRTFEFSFVHLHEHDSRARHTQRHGRKYAT